MLLEFETGMSEGDNNQNKSVRVDSIQRDGEATGIPFDLSSQSIDGFHWRPTSQVLLFSLRSCFVSSCCFALKEKETKNGDRETFLRSLIVLTGIGRLSASWLAVMWSITIHRQPITGRCPLDRLRPVLFVPFPITSESKEFGSRIECSFTGFYLVSNGYPIKLLWNTLCRVRNWGQNLTKKKPNAWLAQALLSERVQVELEVRPKLLLADTNCYIDHLATLRRLIQEKHYTLVAPLVGQSKTKPKPKRLPERFCNTESSHSTLLSRCFVR